MAQRIEPVGDQAFVQNSTNDIQQDPQIAALEGGGYVVVWFTYNSDTVKAQRFDPNGNPVGAAVTVTSTRLHAGFDVIGMPGGGFAVTTTHVVTGSFSQVRLQVFDASAQALGPAALVATASSSTTSVVSMTALDDGRIVIVRDLTGTGQIAMRTYSPAGQPLTAETPVSDAPLVEIYPVIASLGSGGFAVAFETPNSGGERDIHLRLFDASGAPAGAEIVVAAGSADQRGVELTRLAGGGFVVTWQEKAAGGDWDVRAQLFDAAGAKIGADFLVNTVTTSDQTAPSIVALADGGFLAVWEDTSHSGLDTSGTALKAQAFTAAGARVGDETTINDYKPGFQYAPALTALADGTVAAAWVSTDNAWPSPLYGVRSGLFDLATVTEWTGTAAGEQHAGTAGPDDLSGLGGADVLSGGAGRDVLLGGDGDDSLTGGAGDDRLEGGLGQDFIDGGDGDDYGYGGDGDDILNNSKGIDRLDGGDGNDRFNASGTGFAFLYGGAGDDLFKIGYGLSNDLYNRVGLTIDAGDGIDRIEINGLNTIAQISLGAGADTLAFYTNSFPMFGVSTVGNGGGIYISDFQAGAGGDRIEMEELILSQIQYSWDGASNPFASGYYKLEQNGADTLLLERGSLGSDFSTLIVFRNTTATSFTPYNFGGIDPGGAPFAGATFDGSAGPDFYEGGFGGDVIEGQGGNDILKGGPGHDILRGGDDIDQIEGGLGNDELQGDAGGDTLFGGFGNDRLFGGAGQDNLDGGGGDDRLDGGTGADLMYGDGGSDTFFVDDAGDQVVEYEEYGGTDRVVTELSFTLTAGLEELELTGSAASSGAGNAAANLILGNAGANALSGGGGDDRLDGGAGDDTTGGGSGADTHALHDAGDLALEAAGQGIDTVETDLATYQLPDNFEFLAGTGNGQALTGNGLVNVVTGTAGDDAIAGGGGNDVLAAGAGADTLSGGAGRDLLIGGSLGATNLVANGSFEQHVLATSTRSYILQSPTDDGTSLSRNTNPAWASEGGNSSLIGWATAKPFAIELDTARAGATGYNVGGGDVTVDLETGAGQNQSIYQDIAGLAAGARFLLTFSAALPAAGGTAALQVYWNGALVAALVPGSTDMSLYAFMVTAGGGTNRLEFREAGAGSDGHGTVLDVVALRAILPSGDAKLDTMAGGTGDDVYLLDHGKDSVVEAAGEGNDLVYALAGFTLASGQEVERIESLGTGLRLAGNELAQAILGDSGANALYGMAGDDVLQGLAGDDVLDGGTGGDRMEGGAGNDIYFVDSASDQVVEAGGGADAVYTSSNLFAIADGSAIELLATTNSDAAGGLGLFGNEFSQTIIGNAGNNELRGNGGDDTLLAGAGGDNLDGGTGADVMEGGLGDDIYLVDNSGDVVRENANEGTDWVYTSVSYALGVGAYVENIGTRNAAGTEAIDLSGSNRDNTIVGNDGANLVSGGGGNDHLQGLGGNDLLDGGAGQDILEGGAGADVFRFEFVSHSASAAADSIRDFQSGVDKIDLSLLDQNLALAGGTGFHWIGSDAFSGHAGELRFEVVGNAVYLSGDSNGDGLADFAIVLYNTNQIAQTDIIF